MICDHKDESKHDELAIVVFCKVDEKTKQENYFTNHCWKCLKCGNRIDDENCKCDKCKRQVEKHENASQTRSKK